MDVRIILTMVSLWVCLPLSQKPLIANHNTDWTLCFIYLLAAGNGVLQW